VYENSPTLSSISGNKSTVKSPPLSLVTEKNSESIARPMIGHYSLVETKLPLASSGLCRPTNCWTAVNAVGRTSVLP
jgi:hypothetical protein